MGLLRENRTSLLEEIGCVVELAALLRCLSHQELKNREISPFIVCDVMTSSVV